MHMKNNRMAGSSGYRYNIKGTMMIRNPLVIIILMIQRVIKKEKQF